MDARLVFNKQEIFSKIIGEKEFACLSEDRLRVLKALSEPKYPAEIARELKMQAQTAYYHIRLLNQAGLVRLVEYEEKKGGIAKKYVATSDAFSIVVNPSWKPFSIEQTKPPSFIREFVKSGYFNAKIIVGSPEPHGKYRSRASEFCAMEFAMFAGSFAGFSYPLFYLDTEAEARQNIKKENLVLLGGPKVNMIVDEINNLLPINFEEKSFSVVSRISGKKYEEETGIVEIIDNPFNKTKKIMVLAGSNHVSTRLAVLAVIKQGKEIEKGNVYDRKKIAKVVQGFDDDGDGISEVVEFLE